MRPRRDELTRDLFAVPAPVPARPDVMASYRAEVSELVSEMLAEAHAANPDRDRYAVAMQMSRLTGRDVSKNMLDGYSSPAREEFNIPFYLGPALEVACDSYRLGNWYAGVRGGQLLIGADTLNAEIGRLGAMQEQLSTKLRDLKRLQRDLSK